MKKNKSKTSWVHTHINDPYVKLAQKEGYRARAAYKLIELDKDLHILQAGHIVVDLGSTPGSWSQVVRQKLVKNGQLNGRIVALDLIQMDPIADVDFIQGDFREDDVLQKLTELLKGLKVDVVLSDMAPNITGISSVDSAGISHVCELALDFAKDHLVDKGCLLVKVFQGVGFEDMVKLFRATFHDVAIKKPKASRDKSPEVYLFGRRLKK